MNYLLQKERTPSPSPSKAPIPVSSSDEEPDSPQSDPRHSDHSQVGSVQKFLTKAKPAAPAGKPSRGGEKSKPKRTRVARKLAEDLKETSLVNKSSSKSSSGPLDPRLLGNSYADFSSDSAKALIAALEGGGGGQQSRSGSQNSSTSTISVSSSCQGRGELQEAEGAAEPELDTTSLTPVDMEVATPAPSQSTARPILEGVKVFVDFRTGADNRGASVKSLATRLGASVAERLNSEVTHVIFKDGSLATYKKAVRLGIHIVAFSWLEASRKAGEKLAETKHPTVSKEKYDSPGLFPKIRKLKSMQPKTVEEDFESASKSLKRRLKIQARKNLPEEKNQPESPSEDRAAAMPSSSRRRSLSSLDRLTSVINNSPGLVTPVRARPVTSPLLSPSQQDVDTPLAERLELHTNVLVLGKGSFKVWT